MLHRPSMVKAVVLLVLFFWGTWLLSPWVFAEETRISVEELRESPFAQRFKEGDYAASLESLKGLLRRYPKDPLLVRYRAITFSRLGRPHQAISELKKLLEEDPHHIPTHYFLAEAYAQAGEMEQAMREWSWVLENSPIETYRQWAKSALDRIRPLALAELIPRNWSLRGDLGWEWDSNVPLKPSDKALATAGDQNSNRFSVNLTVGYPLVRERHRALELAFTTRNSFHDDGLQELNFFSQGLSLDARRGILLLGKKSFLGGRYEIFGGFLEDDLFSLMNRIAFTAETRFTSQTRTSLTSQLAWINFGPDGSNPPQTSRDGFYPDLEITHSLWTADFQKALIVSQAYSDARTKGGNFERRGMTTRIGIHTPLTKNLQADFSIGFTLNRYPRFTSLSSSDPERRRDTGWDFYIGIARPVTQRIFSRFFYRYLLAKNRNDFFEYERQITGVQLIF